jgi:hypothetical protein
MDGKISLVLRLQCTYYFEINKSGIQCARAVVLSKHATKNNMVQTQYEWETVVHKVSSSFAIIFFNYIDDQVFVFYTVWLIMLKLSILYRYMLHKNCLSFSTSKFHKNLKEIQNILCINEEGMRHQLLLEKYIVGHGRKN